MMMPGILLHLLLIAPAMSSATAQATPVLSVSFEGNHGIDDNRLRSQMRLTRQGGWYHPETLRLELQHLQRFCQDEGYLRARVGPPSVEMQSIPGGRQAAVIRIPVHEGPLYTLGEISVRGVGVFKETTLLHMSPLRTGQPYSRRKVAEWQKVIEDGYFAMGYIRFESKALENIHEARKIVDLAVECTEGAAYRVGRISFEGDDSASLPEVRKLLLLGQGSLYNPQNLTLSLHFLNGARKWKTIHESDVKVEIDDATRTVHFTFPLVPLNKSSSSIDDETRLRQPVF